MPVIPALGKLRGKLPGLEASLGYIVLALIQPELQTYQELGSNRGVGTAKKKKKKGRTGAA